MSSYNRYADGSFDTMYAVIAELNKRGYNATLEFPGWISVCDLCFSDENPTWCWNDGEGEKGGESQIPTESIDVKLIADWITRVLTNNDDARAFRIKQAVEQADLALWASVIKLFPEAKTGDLDPPTVFQLHKTLTAAISEWAYYNLVKVCANCERQLDDAAGKSLGCDRCDGEFCSADCVEAHEKLVHAAEKEARMPSGAVKPDVRPF